MGSYAAQLARLRGACVIGSAGSTEKQAYLSEVLKLDGAFDYKQTPVAAALPEVFVRLLQGATVGRTLVRIDGGG